jgi:hypothetical protein
VTRRPGRGRRALIALALLLSTVTTYSLLVSRQWHDTGDTLRFTAAERAGIAYLTPLTALLGALGEAGAAATRGDDVDFGPVTSALARVDQAERDYGGLLATAHRWTDLSQATQRIEAGRPVGRTASDLYGDDIALAVALAGDIGDRSNLILDPQLDSYYLMDVVLLRLPAVIATVHRMRDEVTLALRTPAPDLDVSLAASTYQLALLADAVSQDVRKAAGATQRAALGPDLTPALDEFRSSIDAIAPPATLRPQAVTFTANGLAAAGQHIDEAATKLAGVTFPELDALLRARTAGLDGDREASLVTAGVGGLLALLLLWWALPAPRERDDDETDGDPTEAGDVAMDMPSIEPRELLLTEELVHTGRSVSARRREDRP